MSAAGAAGEQSVAAPTAVYFQSSRRLRLQVSHSFKKSHVSRDELIERCAKFWHSLEGSSSASDSEADSTAAKISKGY